MDDVDKPIAAADGTGNGTGIDTGSVPQAQDWGDTNDPGDAGRDFAHTIIRSITTLASIRHRHIDHTAVDHGQPDCDQLEQVMVDMVRLQSVIAKAGL